MEESVSVDGVGELGLGSCTPWGKMLSINGTNSPVHLNWIIPYEFILKRGLDKWVECHLLKKKKKILTRTSKKPPDNLSMRSGCWNFWFGGMLYHCSWSVVFTAKVEKSGLSLQCSPGPKARTSVSGFHVSFDATWWYQRNATEKKKFSLSVLCFKVVEERVWVGRRNGSYR